MERKYSGSRKYQKEVCVHAGEQEELESDKLCGVEARLWLVLHRPGVYASLYR